MENAEQNSEGALRRLQKKLRSGPGEASKRHELTQQDQPVAESWDTQKPPEEPEQHVSQDASLPEQSPTQSGFQGAYVGDAEQGEKPQTSGMSFSTKILIGSLAFFAIAVVLFLFVLLGGSNTISARNVTIAVEAPQDVEAGQPVSFRLQITNNNDTDLRETVLIAEFPEGTKKAGGSGENLARVQRELDNVSSGATIQESFEALFYGQEGDEQDVRIRVEYRTEGSNATFVAEETYTLSISSAPLRVSLETPEEVNSGQVFPVTISLSSTAEEALSGILVSLSYPFGFSIQESSRETAFGDNNWRIPELSPGETWSVVVRGTLEGQDRDEKTFRIQTGLPEDGDQSTIGTVYGTALGTVRIVRPFLSAQVRLNGETKNRVSVASGETVSGEIVWQNNTPAKLTNVSVEAELTGNALDKASVRTSDGFFQSADNTIRWDKNTLSTLSEVAPGASGRLSFEFVPRASGDNAGLHNASGVALSVQTTGERPAAPSGEREVTHTTERSVLVRTTVSPAQRALYYSGPLSNTGPLPPKAEQETTYTIVWTLANSLNETADATLEATLPSYISWKGVVSPSGASVTFDDDSRTVRWDAGALRAGTGFTRAPREVVFQIGFTPSISQVGTSPLLVEPVEFTGEDTYTGDDITATAGAVSTQLSADPQYTRGEGTVVE